MPLIDIVASGIDVCCPESRGNTTLKDIDVKYSLYPSVIAEMSRGSIGTLSDINNNAKND